jgi:hypothetical protein
MAKFLEEQAKRLYGLGELEAEALEVLRLIVRQTERGENLDVDLLERAKAIVDRYDRTMMRGHEAPGVIPFRREGAANPLDEIRHFIEDTDVGAIDDATRALVEKRWPWLASKLPPRSKQ